MLAMEFLGYHIVDTARQIKRGFNRRAFEIGSTGEQWRVLAWLSRNGDGPRQVDLADALDVEPITLCRMIDRLEASGMVERKRDHNDRRAWRIHLTPDSRPVVEKLKSLAADFNSEVLEGISPADIMTTLNTLNRVAENLAAMEIEEQVAV